MGNTIVFDKNTDFLIRDKENSSYVFEVEENVLVNVIVQANVSYNFDINIKRNGSLKLSVLNTEENNEFNINCEIKKEGTFTCVFADFCSNNSVINANIDLLEEYAESKFVLSSTSNERYKKLYDVNFNHLNKNTTSKLKVFGVSLKESEIKIKGVSHINENCIGSNASQDCKVILFDKESKGSASPILKIDCDDIKANHACSIGSMNDEHLYYLMSRGIDVETVRKLIVLGYILPVKKYFSDKENSFIDEYIKKEFNYA